MTYTLQVKRREAGDKDSHGNKAVTYADPTDWVVRGYAPGANPEGADPHRDLSIVEWTVYADATDAAPGELDRVVLGGVDFEVVGRPADWTHGPWHNPVAGVVVELKRAEG